MKNILLSICVPTYNRKMKLARLIEKVLAYRGNDIEVIISDNCSCDGTIEFLENIKDSRISILKNDRNIGDKNIWNCMNHAQGKYTMICLDKDYIEGKWLAKLINALCVNEISNGYCKLNLRKDERISFIWNPFQAVLHTGYLPSHPSGYICRTEYYRSYRPVIEKMIKADIPFIFEIIQAELASRETASIIYSKRLVFTETKEEAIQKKSYSSGKDNFYMFYRKIRQRYEHYIDHSYTLPLSGMKQACIRMKLSMTYLNLLRKSRHFESWILIHNNIDEDVLHKENNSITFIKNVILYFLYYIKSVLRKGHKTWIG